MSEFFNTRLGEAVEFIKNGTTATQLKIKSSKAVTRIETIAEGKVNLGKVGFVGDAEDIERYRLITGDILFSHINSIKHIGKTALIRGSEEIYNGMNLLQIRSNTRETDPSFLHELLRSDNFRAEVRRSAKQAVNQASISIAQLQELEICLPPLPEQKKIAEILSGINLCISSTKRKLAKREIMLQSIIGRLFMMPQALGDVIDGHENDTPSVRRVPLKEVCTVRQGLQIPISERSKTRGKGMLPYLTVSWINSNFSIEKAEYIDTPRSSVILEEGEFVVARTGAVGRVFDGIRCVFHNNFFAVKCLPCINSNYLKHYLKSDALQDEMLERAGSTSIPDLNHGDFYSIEVPLHEPDNQKSIVAVIDSMESEICQIKKSIDTLQNLLIGVSSDLLSGRKRVSI